MEDEQVALGKLAFEEASCERRFKAIHAFMAERPVRESWDHIPLHKAGNFIEEAWCHAPEPDWNCFSGYAEKHKGTRWFRVGVLHYPQDFPKTFGLNVSAGDNASKGEWGIHLTYANQGKTVVGSSFGLTYLLFAKEGDTIVQEVTLGSQHTFHFAQYLMRMLRKFQYVRQHQHIHTVAGER